MPIKQILAKTKKRSPLAEQIYLISWDSYHNEKSLYLYNQTAFENPEKEDFNLAILYYAIRIQKAIPLGKYDDASIMFNLALKLINKDTPSVLACYIKATGFLIEQKSNQLITYLKKAITNYTSPRQVSFYISYVNVCSAQGKMKHCQKPPEKLKQYFSKENLYAINTIAPLINGIETFNKKQLDNSLNDYIQIDKKTANNWSHMLKDRLLFSTLFSKKIINEKQCQGNPFVLSTYYLLTNQKEKALETSRLTPTKTLSIILGLYNVRSKLANNHIEAAWQELESLKSINHFMDPFFRSRIEYARGNKNNALKYFAETLKLCKHYDADGLLDFELDLSLELGPRDLRYLFQNTEKINLDQIKTTDLLEDKPTNSTSQLIGKSNTITQLKKTAKKYATSSSSILITGETGVGKDVFAKYLHQMSDRTNQQFIAINCGAISENLIQSELFGHEAGSFTGSIKKHIGVFEATGKGTLFLDEIGEISPKLQTALLRALDSNEFRPIGSNKIKKFNCRILFATNVDLQKLVEKKLFRKDLLYRLQRLEINIPPLSEHSQDIKLLVNHFLQEGRSDQVQPTCTKGLLQLFQNYSWPGNIRQLKNEINKMRIQGSEKLHYSEEDYPLQKEEKKTVKKPIDTIPTSSSETFKKRISDDEINKLISDSSNRIRRLDQLKVLFEKYKKFTRKEIINIFKLSPKTATIDLKLLCQEGFIQRVEPTPTPRTHYFILANEDHHEK